MNQPETEKIELGQFTLRVLLEAIQIRSVEQIKAVTMTLSVHPWHFHGCTFEARATDELAGELHEWTGTELLAAFLAEQAKGGVS